jgi:hypothetical protein
MTATREVVAGREVPSGIGPYSPAVRAREFLFVSVSRALILGQHNRPAPRSASKHDRRSGTSTQYFVRAPAVPS